MQDTIRAITFAEVVILVMDATHPFETQDLQIADLVEREGRALVFVLAKWDLIEDPAERLKAFRETAEQMLPQLRGTPLVALSAETGSGLDRLMPAVAKAHADWSTKVKTKDLNDWLKLAVERHPPPSVNGRRVRAEVYRPDQGAPADVRDVRQPRLGAARQLQALPDQLDPPELRPSGHADPVDGEVGRQSVYGRS